MVFAILCGCPLKSSLFVFYFNDKQKIKKKTMKSRVASEEKSAHDVISIVTCWLCNLQIINSVEDACMFLFDNIVGLLHLFRRSP